MKCVIFMELTRVLIFILFVYVEGVECSTCGDSSCSLKKQLGHDTNFGCTVSGKSGWERFKNRHGLSEKYDNAHEHDDALITMVTDLNIYKTTVRNRVSPNLNISFAVSSNTNSIGHRTVLMKFSSVKDPEVGDQYYLDHPVYRLFDFKYRQNGLQSKKSVEFFYDCITGLDDRSDFPAQVSRRVYNVMFTAFTLQSSVPGVTVSYLLTSYNRKIHNERTWRPNIMTSVFGSNIYVVFERLPSSWTRTNTYYRVLLFQIQSDGSPSIADLNCIKITEFANASMCKFAIKRTGRFFVKVLAYECWRSRRRSPCTRGQSYEFSVDDIPKNQRSSTSVDGIINTSPGQRDNFNPSTMDSPVWESNGTNHQVIESREGDKHNPIYFIIFGIAVGVLLVSVMVVCYWINGRTYKDYVRLELVCDHPQHKVYEAALGEFLGNCLNFQIQTGNTSNRHSIYSTPGEMFDVKLICDQPKTLDNMIESKNTITWKKKIMVILAQKPENVPQELLGISKKTFKWPEDLNHFIDYMSLKNYNSMCLNRKRQNYQCKPEYHVLLKTFKETIHEKSFANNVDNFASDDAIDVHQQETKNLLHSHESYTGSYSPWVMRRDSCPIHGKSSKPNIGVTYRDNSFLAHQHFPNTAIMKISPEQDIWYPLEKYNSFSTDSNETNINESLPTKTDDDMESILHEMIKINFE